MILKAFSLYDTKTGIYGTPFFMAHIGQAVRAIIDLAQDANTTIGRHPADYMLYQLGDFDDAVGMFDHLNPVAIGSVVSMLPRPQPALFEQEA
ncbi:MAG: nonstructural protein [Microviridae sp.]|nr:MAG: nonstructural protein [Microviridae sp.]